MGMGDEPGIEVSVRHITHVGADAPAPKFTAKLWLTGADKPGLLYHLSEAVAEQGLNIEHLQTEQHNQRRADQSQLFSAHCHICSASVVPDVSRLKKRLDELEGQLGVKCSLEVVDQS